jgi:hypothetical protein
MDGLAERLARGRGLLSEIRPERCETLFIAEGRVQYDVGV